VAGRGIERLRAAGLEVTVGVEAEAVTAQLAPYLKHRRTGRPWVVLKLAATLDGRTAAPDGSSQWITGAGAR
jgi:diaminohydroxyphosphoribosylaminopyrimidine deaminase/5-amino-6-(5-phosphoribosylamino)uracil reductase